jgi:hypothetical protein
MGDYELHFAEPGREPFGLRLRLPEAWAQRTTRDLVEHFVQAYGAARPGEAPLPGTYGLVNIHTGRIYAEDALLTDLARDAPLAVVRRDVVAAPPEEEDAVDAEYTLDDALNDGNDGDDLDDVDDEEPLEDLVAAGTFGGGYARSRARLRAALRRRRVSVADVVAECDSEASAEDDDSASVSSKEEESDDDAYQRTAPPERKDWGAINYKKALCPHVVAGRKCPHGQTCTYAHSYDELRVGDKPGKPHVCVGASTAAFELPPPEQWQMGTFAEAERQGPFLWARLAGVTRRTVAGPRMGQGWGAFHPPSVNK